VDVTTRRLQDEAAELAKRYDSLTAIEVEAGSEQETQVKTDLEGIAERAGKIGAELSARLDIEAKVNALRSKVAVEPRGLVIPAVHTSVAAESWDGRGMIPEVEARRMGLMLRDIARGEYRGAFTAATEEPNSHGGLSPTYDGKGSELVFGEFYRGIMGILDYQSTMLQVASRMQTTSNRLTIPRADEDVEAELYLENCEIKPVLLKTTGQTINVEKLGARAQVSNELLEDAVVSVPDLIRRKVATAFAKKIDQLWIEGDATAKIDGLVDVVTEEVTVTDNMTPADVALVVSKINPYAVNPVWVLSQAGIAQMMQAAAAGIGRDVTQGVSMTLYGMPVYQCLAMPDGVLGFFGDFRQASVLVERSNGLTINASRERAIEYDQTVFVATQRFGIASTGPSYAVKLLGQAPKKSPTPKTP